MPLTYQAMLQQREAKPQFPAEYEFLPFQPENNQSFNTCMNDIYNKQ